MKKIRTRSRRVVQLLVCGAVIVTLFMAISWRPSQAALVTRTWDGGGATTNWSEAANWSGDVAPLPGDDIVFDGTSTKNSTIDAGFDIGNLTIAAGYSGTITQSAGSTLNIVNGSSSSQAGGTFVCGANIVFSNVTFNQTGGTFNCAGGSISATALNLIVGGTFTAPLGTMTLTSSGIRITGTGNFDSDGTILSLGNFLLFRIVDGVDATLDLNNLTINNDGQTGVSLNEPNDRLRILGTLNLVTGDTQGIVEARGPVSIASTYGTTNQSGKLVLAGPAQRSVTLPSLADRSYVHIELNAGNTDLIISDSGVVRMKSFDLIDGSIDIQNATLILGTGDSFRQSFQSGGNLTCGAINLSAVEFKQTGGTFDCGGGNITSNFVVMRLHGGTFIAPQGTMSLSTPAPGASILERGGGVFNANNGTVVLDGAAAELRSVNGAPAELDLKNLTVDVDNNVLMTGGFKARVLGNLSHNSGGIFGGTVELHGNATIGTNASVNANTTNFTLAGSANQTLASGGGTLPQGTWSVDKSGGTLTLLNSIDLTAITGLNLNQGTITTGAHVVDVGSRPVNRTSGHVIGNLKRRFTGTGAKVFDVGTANGYAPVTVDVTSLGANPTDLTVGNVQGAHPLLNSNIALGRYWPIAEAGDLTATLTFNYLQPDVNGTEAAYKVNRISGGQVEVLEPPTATVDTANNTATVTAVTQFSDWTLSGTATPLVLDPLNPTTGAGNSIQFNATGGVPPYTFSIPTNNSGGSINAGTGLYFAGTTFGVQDTIQVTDAAMQSVSTNVSILDPFLVINTNDSGPGSLRQAIINANGASGAQTIAFNIPGTAPFTIAPSSPLPVITGTTILDGASQPGYAGVPVIELDGANAGSGNGLEIQAGSQSLIKALAVNRFPGVGIRVEGSSQVAIRGSYVGVGLDGVTPRGNLTHGVLVINSTNNLIGGTGPLDRNVISANAFDGLILSGTTLTSVQSNYIGVGADGSSPLGNGRTGLQINNSSNNLIGGSTAESSNVIAFTGTVNPPGTPRGGLRVDGSSVQNRIARNSIHSNAGVGIDLGGDGNVTPNDVCDVDTGANNLQNFPVLTSATTTASGTTISGTINSTASSNFSIDFYASPQADPSGHGEGKTHIGSVGASTDLGCSGGFSTTLPGVTLPPGTVVTATAWEVNGSSSEFSAAIAVTTVCNFTLNPTSQNFNASGGNGTFAVNTDPNCQWNAATVDQFITIVSTPNGTGSGTVNFIVAPNTTGGPRSGTIAVGGQTFTINQGGTCVFSINPTAQNFGLQGGTGTINVSTNAGCAWTAVSNNAFISVTGGGSGNGPGTVSYSVLSSGGPRTGTITVAGKTFRISQASNALGCPSPSVRSTTSTLAGPGSVLHVVGDFNRDGLDDLLYSNSPASARLVVLLGKGDATFHPPGSTDLSNGGQVRGVVEGDFNRDGFVDVAVKVDNSASGQAEIRIAFGDGYDGFTFGPTLASGSANPDDFVVGDFNNDGKHDIVVRAPGSAYRFFLGNGDGSFSTAVERTGTLGINLRSGDFNGDGRLDIVSPFGSKLDVFLGNGDGSFNVSASLSTNLSFESVTVADLNRDGKQDLIASEVGFPPVTVPRIFLGNGNGGFSPGPPLPQVNGIASTATVDLDRDGKLDLVTSGGLGVPNIFKGTGTGGFTLSPSPLLLTSIGRPLLGDFNQDGKRDFATDLLDSQTGIILNTCGGLTQKPKIDFDGDGKTDRAIWRPSTGEWYVLRSSDLSYFSFQFGTNGDLPTAADFDGDNKTDPAVFRPTTGQWFVLRSSDAGVTTVQFGTVGDRPAAGDYDGDGKTDFAIFRPADGQWWVLRSSDGVTFAIQWGVGTDVIIQ